MRLLTIAPLIILCLGSCVISGTFDAVDTRLQKQAVVRPSVYDMQYNGSPAYANRLPEPCKAYCTESCQWADLPDDEQCRRASALVKQNCCVPHARCNAPSLKY